MNICKLLCGPTLLLLLATLPANAPAQASYSARSGSKMRIEGTSNLHDWQVESPFIAGSLTIGPGFPPEPGQTPKPGKIEAKGDVTIAVRSLKSLEKDGKPYSDSMDDKIYEHMKADQYPKIFFHLAELTLKELPKSADAPYVFETKGDLTVAGVTNSITFPVEITLLEGQKLKVTGSTSIKMTQFKIEPPAPKLAMGLITTGDDVKLIFSWMLAQRKTLPK